jgi:hypothetical protein
MNAAPVASGTELARTSTDYDGLVMVVAPAEAARRLQELQAFVQSAMVRGVDYGTIPGTDKPTLLQPGAQKLEEIYGFAHTFEAAETVQDWEKGFFLYRKRCVLTSRRTGTYIGDGVGSCNSREGRYAYRWMFDNELPQGLDRKALRSETKVGRNGKPYTRYRMPNEDIYSLVNTIEKMAAKRALVHAVIGATRSAGIFTQDVEDLPSEVFGEPEQARSWQRENSADAASSVAAATEEKTAILRAKLEGAKNEAELRVAMAEVSKAQLPKSYVETLRSVAKAKLDALRKGAAAVDPPAPADDEDGRWADSAEGP